MAHSNKKMSCDTCYSQGVWLTNTHLVRLCSLLLLYSSMLFALGYCLGKRTQGITYGSELLLSDQHRYAHQDAPYETIPVASDGKNDLDSVEYYAYLTACGQETEAHHYVEMLNRQGIEAAMRTCVSTSAKGKQVVWYQIVTKNFTNREELVKLVERVRYHDHTIGNVPILTC